jgi:hypothetical protein
VTDEIGEFAIVETRPRPLDLPRCIVMEKRLNNAPNGERTAPTERRLGGACVRVREHRIGAALRGGKRRRIPHPLRGAPNGPIQTVPFGAQSCVAFAKSV